MERLWTRNFLLLVLGQACSLFGNGILRLALSLYLLDKTGSAAIFAGILSASILPTILLSPFGGILADRADKRAVMVLLDTLAGGMVFFAALIMSGGNGVAATGILLAGLSVLGAFETPVVQACVPAMLKGDNIMKGNAVVSQAASLSAIAAPALGGVFYAVAGLRPVMYASAAFFLLTAGAECLIRLERQDSGGKASIREDFFAGLRFLLREEPAVLRLLLLAAGSRFFVMGVTVVGLPFLVRIVLGLGPEHAGAAESALAIAVLLGSGAAGLLAGRWKAGRLSFLLAAMGAALFPAGLSFLWPAGTGVRYAAVLVSFCGVSFAVSVFSIFAVSLIQQRTPNAMMGRIMAHTAALTLCAQPLGQMAYGFLFDTFRHSAAAVLLPTGIFICGAGLLSAPFFKGLERKGTQDLGTFGGADASEQKRRDCR